MEGPDGTQGLLSRVCAPRQPLHAHLSDSATGSQSKMQAGPPDHEWVSERKGEQEPLAERSTDLVTRQRAVPSLSKYQPCGLEQATCSALEPVSSAVERGQDAPSKVDRFCPRCS